ncbi:MAG: stage III sporulation protein AC [Firmicutes bacterium]|nr:stage III sporulation protein AC [Bacillota bacterium]
MGIDIIFKIAAIGILTAVVNIVLKHSGKEEIATFVTLASVIITLLMVLELISNLFETVKTMFSLY